jgi:hypothetical protein
MGKLDEIMCNIYQDIKGKPIYKRLQKHLEEATKSFIKIKTGKNNKTELSLFNESIGKIETEFSEMEKI